LRLIKAALAGRAGFIQPAGIPLNYEVFSDKFLT